MIESAINHELKLLTTSKDVGLRRWRSFAAALGGTGQIFYAVSDLLQHLSTDRRSKHKPIVIYDQSLPLSALDLARLHQCCRLFILRPPLPGAIISVPLATAPAWEAEAYLQCSLTTLLESPVIRLSLMRLVLQGGPFYMESLLRWGYAMQTCSVTGSKLDQVSQSFARSLNLSGEARRLTEMFTHFLQARLSRLGLRSELVTFGFDGILNLVSARCAVEAHMNIRTVAAELRVHDMHITVTNRLPGNYLEIGGLFLPQEESHSKGERMLLVFNKTFANDEPSQIQSADDDSVQASSPVTHKAS